MSFFSSIVRTKTDSTHLALLVGLLGNFQAPGPLEVYFSQYPTFAYNTSEPPTSEFNRMCKSFGWHHPKHVALKKQARKLFRDALTKQFNSKYGTSADDIASWQLLCNRLGIFPIPNTLKECRQVCSYITHGSSPELSCPTDSDEDPCQFSGPCH